MVTLLTIKSGHFKMLNGVKTINYWFHVRYKNTFRSGDTD